MVRIRKFQAGDTEAVKRLIGQILDGEFKEEQAAFPPDDLENLAEAYGHFGETFLVAEEGKKLVGTVGIKKEDERVALLRRVFVAQEYRKRSIGLQLLDRALEFCREVGYRELIFKTTSRMAASIALIQKRGFHPRAKIRLGEVELLKFSLSLGKKEKVS